MPRPILWWKNDRKLIPSVTRVFSTQRELYVYLQAYAGGCGEAGRRERKPCLPRASGRFCGSLPGPKKVFETSAKAAIPEADSRLGTVPFSFDIPLNKIAPGRYECQVSVMDPANHRVAFWVDPLLLRP